MENLSRHGEDGRLVGIRAFHAAAKAQNADMKAKVVMLREASPWWDLWTGELLGDEDETESDRTPP